MPQVFHRSTNSISRVSIFGLLFFLVAIAWLGDAIQRSPYVTGVRVAREQPVPFSHEHHVSGLGIDCRYCHASAEISAVAEIPPTKTCMSCHSQIWADSPVLEPVRASFANNTPLQWVRVNDLPDFVYFNHSIHLNKGVGCSTCHGRVDRMPLTWRTQSLNMDWCLECHRHPEQFVRPREEVFNMRWTPPADQIALGQRLVKEYEVRSLTDCVTCHR
jgi:hypothetical protein